MNTTDKNKTNEKKDVELKVPFIPIIVIGILIFGAFKAYEIWGGTKDVAQSQEIIEQQQEEEQLVEETDTKIYTAPDGKKYEIIATLNIPSLGIKYPVLSSTSESLLKVALNKYWGPNPHEVGNLCILGHNYENTKFFSKLHNIKIGDIVELTDVNGKTLNYTVYETDIIDPDNNDCTSQLTNGHTEITLITCHNKALQRFIVKARAN